MNNHTKNSSVFGLRDRDMLHHLLLAFSMFIGVIFIVVTPSNTGKFVIGCLMAVAYVIWSVVHHKIDGDFYAKNMIEYVLIALLGIVILGGFLL